MTQIDPIKALPGMAPVPDAEMNVRLLDALSKARRDLGRLADALADCVVKAVEYGEQDGGFVAFYLLPTGPIHRAIPLLQDRYAITVRPGFDGRTEESA